MHRVFLDALATLGVLALLATGEIDRRVSIAMFAALMLALALPFAYLHARAGGVSLKVFGGIMIGISFVLLNNVAGHIGLLRNYTPWIVASAPSVLYLLLAMGAFSWLVRYR